MVTLWSSGKLVKKMEALKVFRPETTKMAPLQKLLEKTTTKFSFLEVVFKCFNGLASQVMSQILNKTDNSWTMTRRPSRTVKFQDAGQHLANRPPQCKVHTYGIPCHCK